MAKSALGDSKSQSGTKKSLEARDRVLSEASTIEKYDQTKNKVPKINQVQRPDECRLMICGSIKNAEADHANTNKRKVTMISLELSPQLQT